jgi:putative sigma-54 modulation protein
MQLKIKTDKMGLTDAIKDYAQKKVDMIEKYLGAVKAINCDIILGKTVTTQQSGKIYKVEINLELPHELLNVEKTTEDLYKSIDKAKDHLVEMIKKYKEKMIDKNRGK